MKLGIWLAPLLGVMAVWPGWAQQPPPGSRPGGRPPPPATGPAPTGPGSLTGVWGPVGYKASGAGTERARTIKAADGQSPPLLPAANALLEQRIKSSEVGRPPANSLSMCLPGGVPEMLFGPFPVEIVERPDHVIFLFEEQNHFRTIRLGGKHPEDPDPSWFGDAVGHWEGNTLVVDTVALSDKTWLDQIGTAHSEDMHLVERYTRTGPSRIDYTIDIDDPKTFSRPWQVKATLGPSRDGPTLNEYICENNRNQANPDGTQGLQNR